MGRHRLLVPAFSRRAAPEQAGGHAPAGAQPVRGQGAAKLAARRRLSLPDHDTAGTGAQRRLVEGRVSGTIPGRAAPASLSHIAGAGAMKDLARSADLRSKRRYTLRGASNMRAATAVIVMASAVVIATSGVAAADADTSSPATQDPLLWLEQVDGARAMQWVR